MEILMAIATLIGGIYLLAGCLAAAYLLASAGRSTAQRFTERHYRSLPVWQCEHRHAGEAKAKTCADLELASHGQ